MSQVYTYDFTAFKTFWDYKSLKDKCVTYGKKWCFQEEECPSTGALHYQGRISLKTKVRESGARKIFPNCHITITSAENRDNNFYVSKEDTRVNGPWKDTDDEIPDDIAAIKELLPWQRVLMDELEEPNWRRVDIVIDRKGGTGKSTFCRWAAIKKKGKKLPFCNDYRDIMRMAYCVGVHPIYFIDMPRAIGKDRLYQLYGAIEELKGGYAFDDRYTFKDRYFTPPRVVVFTNSEPDYGLLSMDRWSVYEIIDGQLELRLPGVTREEDFPPNNPIVDFGGAAL